MENLDFDSLLVNYKSTVDQWLAAIREEESLASDDHSMVAMELWDHAAFKVQDAEAAAKKARELYKSGLRKKNYGF